MDYTLRISGDFKKGECKKCPIGVASDVLKGKGVIYSCMYALGGGSKEFCPLEEATVEKNAMVEGEWIETSERLPESITVVLMTVESLMHPTAGYYLGSENCWRTMSGSDWDMEEVTAWMPLPESYKKGGK